MCVDVDPMHANEHYGDGANTVRTLDARTRTRKLYFTRIVV